MTNGYLDRSWCSATSNVADHTNQIQNLVGQLRDCCLPLPYLAVPFLSNFIVAIS